MFRWLKSRLFREIRVTELNDQHDVMIEIDAADGTPIQTLSVRRNDFFSIAWVCLQAERKQTYLTTLEWTGYFRTVEEQTVTLSIPDWAFHELSQEVRLLAISMGWQGEFYRRAAGGPFRQPVH